uniref:Uncharacterized protein n=1 Tax=Nelumbo nucifera TaxID=4432 RepID=A0A822XGS7_NELNU|nr:TPA_asm: hypothetical protein HUJ06_020336 [Nelumbo nucifera]
MNDQEHIISYGGLQVDIIENIYVVIGECIVENKAILTS